MEYGTRIATQPLVPDMGSVREALSSLHALFGLTREILKSYGPGIGKGPNSLGAIAIRLLNEGLRPFLVTWHTKLSSFEDEQVLQQQKELGAQHRYVTAEDQWEEYEAFYQELEKTRLELLGYVEILARIAGVIEESELESE